MTLIIGCKTKDFGLIAGDTQLSIGDLQRDGIDRREVEIKVNRPSSDCIFGILGKWSRFLSYENETSYTNYYDQLRKSIREHSRVDKVEYIKRFLDRHNEDIDASVIYVNRVETGFELNSMSSSTENNDLKRLTINDVEFLFNEPFYHTNKNFIEQRIKDFSTKNNLNNSLADSIFLVNNIVLDLICEGKLLSMDNEGVTNIAVSNSVGGFVTIDVLTKDKHSYNCLYQPYFDKNVLLDKTTFPFANYVYNHTEIRYTDNIAMLIRSHNNILTNIKNELLECINKHVDLMVNENRISVNIMNELIEFINQKYSLNIIKPTYIQEEIQPVTLFDVIDNDYVENSIEYYKRFF